MFLAALAALTIVHPAAAGPWGTVGLIDFDYEKGGDETPRWAALFADAPACVTPVLRLDETLAHPHFQARGMVIDAATERLFNRSEG